ncbi:hypothetical protein BLS_000607 [Venturia inaequalis]|uniref:Myosin-2 n=1 Tax=Venturia inaequalis TaxID=5025 RepID=A0A8H3V0E5_VENIN|nr:hypothetical protein EG328_004034 [Venturia inaequalis]KAE9978483.1 hypothetical protein BLS_000607 [Venturia inaequalis]RDI79805.1 hypothetical protein Vi05172_g10232 [Venturia inaequalis]
MDIYQIGTEAWVQTKDNDWIAAKVESKVVDGDKVKLTFLLDNGEKRDFDTTLAGVKDDSPGLPPLRNPPQLEGSDDLTSLSHLNEPAVLQAIKMRYAQREIYTYSGIVLIATNPFDKVDSLYVPGMVQAYTGKPRAAQSPHLFAIAEEAFADMLRDNRNQTIVVSGESGAGKTVSARHIMRYFATREQPDNSRKRSKGMDEMSETEQKILATNPIMEAFGNAKTTRNDNSSRFGKYLEIMFNVEREIIGAKIKVYLLERSRLVFQPLKERNYHIFYQLISGSTAEERKEWGLKPVDEFNYLNQGLASIIEKVDDGKDFNNPKDGVRAEFSRIGVTKDIQAQIYKVLAALLHLGNIKISDLRGRASVESDDEALIKACELLGINATTFAKCTVVQTLTLREKTSKELTKPQALVARDSVAKYIYSSLFDWLVEILNGSLAGPELDSQTANFIGVLDIYGFEHFATNSFEQFCINYANEKLQQEFNQHVFKLEQEEYSREEINWTFIDYADNQPCIDLIEGRNPLGVLALLDAQSAMPAGNDELFVESLHHTHHTKSPFYKKPRFGKSSFAIKHYAVEVTYESSGFLEKNRDTVPDEIMDLLRASTNEFIADILAASDRVRDNDASSANAKSTAMAVGGQRVARTASRKKATLGGIFKASLSVLMKTIEATDVHYIRCIKPNEPKTAWAFENKMVLDQLRACGVLETVRISCAGYPTRWTYEDFGWRYYMLLHSSQWSPEPRIMADRILSRVFEENDKQGATDKYQLGLTKIFFRAGMLAVLENKRNDRLNDAAIMIQKNLRCTYYRRRFLEARQSVVEFQATARAWVAKTKFEENRKARAATVIQSSWRMAKVRKSYNATRHSIILFQSVAKSVLHRRRQREIAFGKAAAMVTRIWRTRKQQREFRDYRKKVVKVQSLWRGRTARIEYKVMRAEARDLKQISYQLENKVVELSQSLGTARKRNKDIENDLHNTQNELQSWRTRHSDLEAKNKDLQRQANQAGISEAKLSQLEAEHTKLKHSYDETTVNMRRLQEEERALRQTLKETTEELDITKRTSNTHESEKLTLRQQLADMADQMERLKMQGPLNGEMPNGMPHTQPAGLINLVSSKRPKRRSAGHEAAGHLDRFSAAYNPRPVSMAVTSAAHHQNLSGSTFSPQGDNIELELEDLLSDEDGLNDEVTMGLIRNLKIPSPSSTPPPSDKEVLFPAYLINLVTSEMWNNGFVKESERFLANVMQSIQQEVMQHDGDEAINPGAFWLSNVHEMLSFVFLAEDWYEQQKTDNYEYDRLLEIVKHDLESLEFNIYHTWMKVLKKKLHKMIVPAIIESQSLPGFVTNEGNRFLGKLLPSSNTPAFSMDQLLSLLNNVYKAMKAYYLEDSIITQTVTELLRLVGVTAFNDLLMRRNFLSWKRGLQINYNITRIEEWCKSHDMPEGTLQLEHLMQATKLLQLKKATLNDIEIIQDICWMLSPTQIQKLLNQYLVADYEQPINGEIMKAVASRVTEKSDVLLLTAVDMEDSGPYEIAEPRVISALETYTPSWLQTPRLKRLAEIVSAQAIAQQDKGDTPLMNGNGFSEAHGLAISEVEGL